MSPLTRTHCTNCQMDASHLLCMSTWELSVGELLGRGGNTDFDRWQVEDEVKGCNCHSLATAPGRTPQQVPCARTWHSLRDLPVLTPGPAEPP
ncbi:hypothetical protein AALO_G00025010 [Alosa alosa]|uniref:Uncharacterized protein n=1 Tax=Alosa alosa TaxID=278164 RepID=A0AAV6HE29_9TELE|nr:hypothetical protein AALO_G00025010 [Alosa alosa]